jgi:hypothetical protein
LGGLTEFLKVDVGRTATSFARAVEATVRIKAAKRVPFHSDMVVCPVQEVSPAKPWALSNTSHYAFLQTLTM